jgi:hypothetical protein
MSTVASRIDRPKTSPTSPNGPERAARSPSDATLVAADADDARRVAGMQAADPRRHQDSHRGAGSKARHSRARRSRQVTVRVAAEAAAHAVGRSCSSPSCNVHVARGRTTYQSPSVAAWIDARDRPIPSSWTRVASAWHGRLGRPDGDPAPRPPGATHSIVEALSHPLHVSHRGREVVVRGPCRVSLTLPCGRGLLRRGRRGVEPGAGTSDPRRTLPRRGLQPSSNRMSTGKPRREGTPWRTDGAG